MRAHALFRVLSGHADVSLRETAASGAVGIREAVSQNISLLVSRVATGRFEGAGAT